MNKNSANEAPAPGHIRLRLKIAYLGGDFSGWQSQANGSAVQDAIERAFHSIVGKRVVVHGSGRTDAGVHATGQVAHADVPQGRLSPEGWIGALNARLPRGVRVMEARRAPARFHARFSAVGKVYHYRIWNHRVLHPLEAGRVWHLPSPLDPQILRETARLLTGTHDFAAFAANRGKPDQNTVRTIHSIRISGSGPLLNLRFEGDGFLYHMVRLLTGSMVRVAQGKATNAWLEDFLKNPHGRRSSFCAPADGLTLSQVKYR